MNEEGLYDVYGTWHIPFWQTNWFFWSVLVIVLSILLCVVWFFYKRFLRKKQILTPYQKALANLQELQARKINGRADAQKLYFDLTFTLKEYIQNSLGYPVLSMTDSELLSYLSDHYVPAQAYTHLKDICNGCLYVKFAQEQALNEHITQDLAKSHIVIDAIEQYLKLKNK